MNKKLVVLVALLSVCAGTYAQQRTVAAGGVAAGTGGTMAYTVGLIDHNNLHGSGGTADEGIQQAMEIFRLGANTGTASLNIATDISLYPNPAHDNILLAVTRVSKRGLCYTLTDMAGKLIYREKINETNTEIILQPLPAGTYLMRICENGKAVQTIKVIKN